MRKWQILEFDGKPYYAFVPENEEPIDTTSIPNIEEEEEEEEEQDEVIEEVLEVEEEDVGEREEDSFHSQLEKIVACKVERTSNTEPEDESMGNDASFYDYQYDDSCEMNEEHTEATEIKPILINGVTSESKDSRGDLYQVKVEGSLVTIEKLAENVVNVKTDDNGDAISEDEEEEEVLVNNPIGEDEQAQEVPQFIEADSMDSQAIEYITENEEDVDDVETIEEIVPDPEPISPPKTQRSTKYRSILPKTTAALKCRVCSEIFSTKIAFRKHVAWTHKKKVCIQEDGVYICAVCDYRTLKKSLFAAHLERKHETWPRKGQNNLVFPCAVCGFVCRSKHSLQSHFIRKHTDNYEHQCKFCPKKFKVKGDLTNHVRFHHKEKPINCDVCGKLCQNSGSLYVHQKWAHYKPKFECTICKRRMVTQENLDQHMVTQHEKREKIVCAECGKTFTKKDSFKRHMAVHTGSKPHHCPICNKPFARQSQLRQHVLIHTGKRPFVCDICGKAFTQKPGLICHRKTHPGPHPPLPVMPIADLVKEFTAEYLQENGQINEEIDMKSE
ncbi:zinc finger protein 436-like [Chelonus insularis]|uniref:zinc finger protein 436-like n=1 Tax=Chelonus insularis TaxID=460826 RepID=UPI00158B0AD7|nr:zinc finger protein 436-like [Chelonus insularis]